MGFSIEEYLDIAQLDINAMDFYNVDKAAKYYVQYMYEDRVTSSNLVVKAIKSSSAEESDTVNEPTIYQTRRAEKNEESIFNIFTSTDSVESFHMIRAFMKHIHWNI